MTGCADGRIATISAPNETATESGTLATPTLATPTPATLPPPNPGHTDPGHTDPKKPHRPHEATRPHEAGPAEPRDGRILGGSGTSTEGSTVELVSPYRIDVWIAEPSGSGEHCSDAERNRAAGHRDPAAAARWLGARGFLRDVLGTALGSAPAGVELVEDAGGKPRIAGSPLEFSVSHARDTVAVAVAAADLGPIGVDLEGPRRLHHAERLARRLCPGPEYEDWVAMTEPERTYALLRRWTRVEALLKATGDGIRGGIRDAEARLGSSGWVASDLELPREMVGAVAARSGDWHVVVRDQTQRNGT